MSSSSSSCHTVWTKQSSAASLWLLSVIKCRSECQMRSEIFRVLYKHLLISIKGGKPSVGFRLHLCACSTLINTPIGASENSRQSWRVSSFTARLKGLFKSRLFAKQAGESDYYPLILKQRSRSVEGQKWESLLLNIQLVNTKCRQCGRRWAISITDPCVPHHRLRIWFHFLYLAFGINAIVSLF